MKNKKDTIVVQLTGKQLVFLISGIFTVSVISLIVAGPLINSSFLKKDSGVRATVKPKNRPAAIKAAPAGRSAHKAGAVNAAKRDDKNKDSRDKEPPEGRLTFFESVKDKEVSTDKTKSKPSSEKAEPKDIKTSGPSSVRYTIQVVSYRSIKMAEKLKDQLSAKGYDAYTVMVDIPDRGKFHRVLIGKFTNSKDAKKTLSKLIAGEARTMKLGRPIILAKNTP